MMFLKTMVKILTKIYDIFNLYYHITITWKINQFIFMHDLQAALRDFEILFLAVAELLRLHLSLTTKFCHSTLSYQSQLSLFLLSLLKEQHLLLSLRKEYFRLCLELPFRSHLMKEQLLQKIFSHFQD